MSNKNIKQMRAITKIRKEIRAVDRELENLKRITRDQSSLFILPSPDKLRQRLESICSLIEEYFRENPSKRRRCNKLLDKVFNISESLKLFYIIPAAYEVSLNIFDTMKIVNKKIATD